MVEHIDRFYESEVSPMATSSITQNPAQSTLLYRALQADGIVSMISGVISLLDAGPLANMMGLSSSTPIVLLGIVMLVYGIVVFAVSGRIDNLRTFGMVVIDLNVVWVIASIALLVTNALNLSNGGNWTVLIVADIVAALAIAQFVGWRRLR
jgi:hypothetical protein